MPSRNVYHSALLTALAMCFNHYRMRTPGLFTCVGVDVVLPSSPEALAVDLVVQVNYGKHKQCSVPEGGNCFVGAPNLVLNLFESDAVYQQRRALFAEAGVLEYLSVRNADEIEVTWNQLVGGAGGAYEAIDMAGDGMMESMALPGFWMPKPALRARDWWTILSAIEHGVTRKPHHESPRVFQRLRC